jgi:hypothetical protein
MGSRSIHHGKLSKEQSHAGKNETNPDESQRGSNPGEEGPYIGKVITDSAVSSGKLVIDGFFISHRE